MTAVPPRKLRPPCSCGCGREARARGLAHPCWKRWDRAGRPSTGAPQPMPRNERVALSTQAKRAARDERMDDYSTALSWGYSRAEAADWAGVHVDTARNYDRLLAAVPHGLREAS